MKKIFKLFAFVMALALAVTLAACKKTTISLSATEATIVAGNSQTITATVSDSTAVVWTSSDDAIATVADGKITGVKAGTATITATAGKVSATVAVTVSAVTLTVTTKTIAIEPSKTSQIAASTNASATITYKSSDEAVATVSASGLVTGVKAGTATITVAVAGVTESVTVTVAIPKAKSVTITATDGTDDAVYVAGATLQLTAAVLPATADQSVTWASDDDSIATVDANGLVTFVGLGDGAITATSVSTATATATYEFSSKAPNPETVTVKGAGDATTVVIEGTLQFSASILPELAPQSVIWSTSDATLATIDENGLLTAIAAGKVTVTATSKSLSTISGSLEIEITLPDPAELTLNLLDPTASTIAVPETTQIVAGITPALADQSVTFKSSDDKIATVDGNGLVTAVAVGKATITVTSTKNAALVKTIDITIIAAPTRPAHNDVLLDVAAAAAAKYSSITYEGEEFINGLNWFSDAADAFAAALENGKIYVTAGYYSPADQLNIAVSNLTIIGTEEATVYTHDMTYAIDAEAATQTSSILKAAKIVYAAGVHDITFKNLVFTGACIFITDPEGNKVLTFSHNIFSSISSASNANFASMDGMFSLAAKNGFYNEDIVIEDNVFVNGFSNPRMGRIYNVNNFAFTGNIIADSFTGYFYDYFRLGSYDSDMGKKYGVAVTDGALAYDDSIFTDSIVANNASGVLNFSNNYVRFCNQSFIYASILNNADLVVTNNHLEAIPAVLWNRGAYPKAHTTMTFFGNNIIDCGTPGWDAIGTWGGENITFNVNYNYFTGAPDDGCDLAWNKGKLLNLIDSPTTTDASKNIIDAATITISADDPQFTGMDNGTDVCDLTKTRFVGNWSALQESGAKDSLNVYATLDAALAAAAAGDTIIMSAGSFDGATVSLADITIVGLDKYLKDYDETSEYSELSPHTVVTSTITAADGISGLTIDGIVLTTGASAAISTNGVTNFTMKNCVMRGISANEGVKFLGASTGILIDNNTMSKHAANRPFWIYAELTDVTFTNNVTLSDITQLWDVFRTQTNHGKFLGNTVFSNNYIRNANQYVFNERYVLGTTYTIENNYFKDCTTAIGFSNPSVTTNPVTITIKGNTFDGTGVVTDTAGLGIGSDWDSIDVAGTANITAVVSYNSFINGDNGTTVALIIKVRTANDKITCANNYFDDADYASKCSNATNLSLLDTTTAYTGTEVHETGEIFFVTIDSVNYAFVYGVGGSAVVA